MKTIIKTTILIMISSFTFAQQNSLLNHYIFNQMTINPAYVGTKQWTNLNFTTASQWTGLEGAPFTQVLSLEGPISQSNGLGVQIINDKIGAQYQQSIYGSFSHILKLNENWKLSMGIAAGISYFTLDGTVLNGGEVDDPSVPKNRVNTVRFDPKTGVFIYSDRFYAGFSVNDLLGDLIQSKDVLITKQARHYYLTSGYVFDIGDNFKLKPSFLIREDLKAQSTMDLNTFMLYKETFWVGLTYRFGVNSVFNNRLDNTLRMRNAMVFMTEWNISKSFIVGYAYTMSTSALSGFSGHEIEIAYTFPKKENTRMRTPRYF